MVAKLGSAARALLVLLAGCAADEEVALRALRAQGLVNVRLGLYPFFACTDGELFNSAFTAQTIKGIRLEGAVCCSIGGGCTIRYQ